MTKIEREEYILSLDEELLNGGIILSECTVFMTKDAEIAFCNGANLSCILACQAAIESHLRFDHFMNNDTRRWGFFQLINDSSLDEELKMRLHRLRAYRNKWVHINDPHDDYDLLINSTLYEDEIMNMAKESIRTMLETLYNNPLI
ncbi:hypothetical protein GCM10028819_33050 [Spirosoma humi]